MKEIRTINFVAVKRDYDWAIGYDGRGTTSFTTLRDGLTKDQAFALMNQLEFILLIDFEEGPTDFLIRN